MKTFTFDYPVRHDDLDFMAIIGNAEWITILTRARIELLDRINKNIPLPADIFQPERKNSVGIDLSNRDIIAKLQHYYAEQAPFNWQAEPIIPGLKNKFLVFIARFLPRGIVVKKIQGKR